MQEITTERDLKFAIQQLEYRQAEEWVLLKGQIHTTYESLKPVNIIKNAFKEIISSPDSKANVVTSALGSITGLAAKKIFIGKSHNLLKKLSGILLEMFIANKVTKNADEIKSIGGAILKKIIN